MYVHTHNLTSEFMKGGIWLQIKLLPVFIEGLHTGRSRLSYHHFGDFEHSFMRVSTSADLQRRLFNYQTHSKWQPVL